MEQNKHVNLDKIEFEHRVKWKIIAPSGFLDHQVSAARKNLDNFSTWRFARSQKLLIEIMMEKIKPQLTEKHDFHNRGGWKRENSVRFQSIRILFQKLKNLSIESSSTIVGILIDILMAEAKPLANQKNKFEDSVKSVSKSVIATLVQSKLRCKKENRLLFNRLICHNSIEFDWGRHAANQSKKFGGKWNLNTEKNQNA